MRRVLMMATGATVLLVLVAVGVVLLWNHRTASAQSTGDSAPQPVRVHVVTPHQGGVERTVTRPAAIHSFQYADLYAKVAGYLRNQVVDIGDRVQHDQVLAEIDAPEILANVKQAKADLSKARAQVQVMTARVEEATADVQEAQVKVEQAEADLLNAVAMLKLRQEQYQRIKRLVELKSVEQELADEKLEAQKAAESKEVAQRKAVTTAKVAVTTAKARLAATRANLVDAQAQAEVAEAALGRAEVFHAYLKLRAPFDGVITRRSYHEGYYILEGRSQGNKPVLTIARTDLMRVIVDVPDPDVPFTHRGAPAELHVDALPGRVFTGKVARTARAEDYNSRTMRAEVDLPNPKDVLSDGMFGSITIHLGADPHALTIPTASLVGAERDGKRGVYVVQHGKAHLLHVHVRRDDGIHAEIATGLDPGAQVIAGHGPGLADGVPVVVEQD